MKKLNIFTVFLITAVIVISMISPAASALTDPEINAGAAILVEIKSGKVLYAHNEAIRVAPGSIAKIMTLLLAVEEVEKGQIGLNDTVTASKTFLNGLSENVLKVNIKPGEEMSYEELMFCAFVASANDACNILAEKVSGSVSDFVARMNEKADELGCCDTFFMNTGGLSDPGQYTSAWDQHLIFKEAVSHPLFLQIAGTVFYKVKATNVSPERSLTNSNVMLRPDSPAYYNYSLAGKTASSGENSYSLVAYASNNELSLISVVFGVKPPEGEEKSETAPSFSETTRLFEWGFSGFAWQDIIRKYEIAASKEIAMAKGADTIDLQPSETLTVLARSDLTEDDIQKDIVLYTETEGKVLTAPVREGDILGEMTVYIAGISQGKVSLIAAHTIELDRTEYIKSQIMETLSLFWVLFGVFVLLLLIGVYIWFVIRDLKRRRERKLKVEAIKNKIAEERRQQRIYK